MREKGSYVQGGLTQLRCRYKEADLRSNSMRPPILSELARVKWAACEGGRKEPILGCMQVGNGQSSAEAL